MSSSTLSLSSKQAALFASLATMAMAADGTSTNFFATSDNWFVNNSSGAAGSWAAIAANATAPDYFTNSGYTADDWTKVTDYITENAAKAPSAVWMDQTKHISALQTALVAANGDLVVGVVYNLPNRDCYAVASNGELGCCADGVPLDSDFKCAGVSWTDTPFEANCSAGLSFYNDYIDQIKAIVDELNDGQNLVLVIEPDSLPNMITNTAEKNSPFTCGFEETQYAYAKGVQYAVDSLCKDRGNVACYLDAAHGGWLGWPSKATQFMDYISNSECDSSEDCTVTIAPDNGSNMQIQALNIYDSLRGFATNVANYQPSGTPGCSVTTNGSGDTCALGGGTNSDVCCEDPTNLLLDWSLGNTEYNFAQVLRAAAADKDLTPKPVIIDTARSGVTDMRTGTLGDGKNNCADWCQPRGAGLGEFPAAQPHGAEDTVVDAYFWVKPPGTADGNNVEGGDGYDEHCAMPNMADAIQPSAKLCESSNHGSCVADSLDYFEIPHAGDWNDKLAVSLAVAVALKDDDTTTSSTTTTSTTTTSYATDSTTMPASTTVAPTGVATCTLASGCELTSGYCAQSEDNCLNQCGGTSFDDGTGTGGDTTTGFCSWNQCDESLHTPNDFCDASESQCTGNCGGEWCSSSSALKSGSGMTVQSETVTEAGRIGDDSSSGLSDKLSQLVSMFRS